MLNNGHTDLGGMEDDLQEYKEEAKVKEISLYKTPLSIQRTKSLHVAMSGKAL